MSLEKLFEGADLTEEAKEQLTTIFEAAVADGVAGKTEALKEQYEEEYKTKLEEEVESLSEKVNDYLKYVTQEFMEQNEIAIDTGLKVEMMESFFADMKKVFENHSVEVPEGKEDVVESLTKKVEELESRLDEATEAQIKAQKSLEEAARKSIVAQVAEGLTEIEADKLATLCEDMEFVSEEKFATKVKVVRETYFTEEREEGDEPQLNLDEGEGVDIDEDKILNEDTDQPQKEGSQELNEDEDAGDDFTKGIARSLDLF